MCTVCRCKNAALHQKKFCARHRQELWRKRNPMRAVFRSIRDNAVRRKKAFDLTWEDFQLICKMTGYLEGRGQSPLSLSLDRIDATEGYTLENLRVITVAENSRKGRLERRINLEAGRFITWDEISVMSMDELKSQEAARRKAYVAYYREQDGDRPFMEMADDPDPFAEDDDPF